MSDQPIPDQAERDAALDVERSFIVQAPAGSGKTELLIQRYLRLLARVERPEEILAITFTRKAAAEMRTRILAALERARAGEQGDSEHERRTLAAAGEALNRDRDREWQLTAFPERMQIMTLDAFNARLAAALPVTSGLGGRVRMVSEAGESGIYREAARATLDWVAESGETGDAVRGLFRHLDNDALVWERSIAEMLERRDQWLAITGTGPTGQEERLRRHFEQAIAMLVTDRLRSLDRALPEAARQPLLELARFAAGNLAEAGRETPLAPLHGCDVWPAPDARQLAQWQALAWLLIAPSSGDWRKRADKNLGFPPGSDREKEALTAVIESLAGCEGLDRLLADAARLPPPRYAPEQWEALTSLLHVLPRATAELKTRFAARGLADYVEVALAARTALGPPDEPTDLALALDYRIRHLLIDEMQDTSLGQYALLESLTAGWDGRDGRTVFCVGDPMQSIYRFREAEVGLFLALRARGIGLLRPRELVLQTNFRSGGNLVDWANRAFARVMPAEDDLATGAIRHSPSQAAPGREGLGECRVHALLDASPREEAETVRRLLREAMDEPGPGEVAVLVRSRTHLRELLPLLRADGVAYEALEIDRLTDLPEVQDLLALTRALIHPLDRVAWLALLRAPWCGLTLAGLHALTVGDALSPVMDLMDREERLARLDAGERRRVEWVRERLAAALERPGLRSLRERVELAWFSLGGPTLLPGAAEAANACRYLDILESLESGGTLPDVADLESRLDEERVSSEGAGARVQVMTIHKAKGLEFDAVVLMGLGRQPRGNLRAVLNWLTLPDEEGHEHLLPSPIGARGERDNDPLHEFIHGVEAEKQRLELDRLLYVACTRARRTLHLVGHTLSRDGSARPPPAGTLLARLWPALEADFARAAEADAGADEGHTAGDPGAELVAPRIRRAVQPYRAGELPVPVAPPALRFASPGAEAAIEYAWVGRDLRHVGTVVHGWLQRMADWPDVDVARRRLEGLDERHASLLETAGVSAEGLEAAVSRVRAALRGTLEDPAGRWILFGTHRTAATELPIEGIADGRLLRVVIDRCFVDESGTHWVVDYKTSLHEGGDLERFLSEEARRYAEQMAGYRRLYAAVYGETPLSLLYYPLHGRVVAMDEAAALRLRDGLPG
ncbi:UvrD-helicase domain-containing protein [Lentisalinibacter salinarum]|uniref:UvrD-helicase domain-containing protein n=1 Tax=Lentisalinibacter salinarum TaxID=2992239 RepID=UPI00386B6E2A